MTTDSTPASDGGSPPASAGAGAAAGPKLRRAVPMSPPPPAVPGRPLAEGAASSGSAVLSRLPQASEVFGTPAGDKGFVFPPPAVLPPSSAGVAAPSGGPAAIPSARTGDDESPAALPGTAEATAPAAFATANSDPDPDPDSEPEIEFMSDGPLEIDEPVAAADEPRTWPGAGAEADPAREAGTPAVGAAPTTEQSYAPSEPHIQSQDSSSGAVAPPVRAVGFPAEAPAQHAGEAAEQDAVAASHAGAMPPHGGTIGPLPETLGPADDPPPVERLPGGEALDAERPAPPAARAAPRRAEVGGWRGIVLVTGTDTDVGKTIVTAAVAAAAQASGLRVAVIKPGQTGMMTGEPTDIDVISRLAGPDTVRTLAEYPEPMAPLAAATVAGLPPLDLYEVVDAIRAEAEKHDLVLVEGAGGLLVPMGVRPSGESWTVADLATTLGIGALVVARAGLGTLNHTALTLEALNRRGVPAGVIIGAWPAAPELVHWANLSELVPHLVGALPAGAGRMDPGVFRRSAPGWLTPALYGVLDNWRVWAEEVS